MNSDGYITTPGSPFRPAASHAGRPPVSESATYLSITRMARTLFLRGELDMSSHHLLITAAEDLTSNCAFESKTRIPTTTSLSDQCAEPAYALVDATRLSFIDAGGLGVLVTLRTNLDTIGIALQIINATSQVRRVITICGLGTVLGLHSARALTT